MTVCALVRTATPMRGIGRRAPSTRAIRARRSDLLKYWTLPALVAAVHTALVVAALIF